MEIVRLFLKVLALLLELLIEIFRFINNRHKSGQR